MDDDDLKRLLFDCVESFEELHVLVWLKAREHEEFDEQAIAEGTRIHVSVLSETLTRLAELGLVFTTETRPPRYRYAPREPAMREGFDTIIARYQTNPLEIMGVMTANAIERVRTAALSTFANSFRIRGPKRDD